MEFLYGFLVDFIVSVTIGELRVTIAESPRRCARRMGIIIATALPMINNTAAEVLLFRGKLVAERSEAGWRSRFRLGTRTLV